MNVLVTGGCGFLGSNIADSYLESGADVVVIDALFREGSERNLQWLASRGRGGRFRHHAADLADAGKVDEIFRREGPFDYICHFGGQVAMTSSLADPRRDMMTNVVGTVNLLEATRLRSPGAFLAYSSTNKVYGDLDYLDYGETETRYVAAGYPAGFDEGLKLDFSTPYGCSKGAADQYVRDWHRVYGIKTAVFRHSSIFGGRQFATADQGWIGWFCAKAQEQKRFPGAPAFSISGTGKQVRDILHSRDLIRLYRMAYDRREAVAGQIFNIGGGMANSLSLLELFSHLEAMLGMPPLRFERKPERKSDQRVFVADCGKAKALIGWEPAIDRQQGLRLMLEWTGAIGPGGGEK